MARKAIETRIFSANVRETASFGQNIVGTLRQADPVETTGDIVGDRWTPCSATLNGSRRQVFISKNVLRDRVSDARERLIRECVRQFFLFDKGRAKEHARSHYRIVGKYWQSIGYRYDGRDRHVPWSAAFISYCVREARGYRGFRYAAAHARYTNQAIRRRLDGEDGPFWGFRRSEHRPQLGDMVCRSRAGSGITYNYAADHDAFKSHCDIVVRIGDGHVVTLGGNVAHSVTRTNYPLNSRGFLANTGRVFAVLRNNR